MNKLPIPYKIIIDKLACNSYKGEIKICNAKKILSHYFRFSKEEIGDIISEMKREKLIYLNKFTIIIVSPTKSNDIFNNRGTKYYQ